LDVKCKKYKLTYIVQIILSYGYSYLYSYYKI